MEGLTDRIIGYTSHHHPQHPNHKIILHVLHIPSMMKPMGGRRLKSRRRCLRGRWIKRVQSKLVVSVRERKTILEEWIVMHRIS